ncbi:helix-turn-helix domain-containing protein [Priestia megaterium]|jgi:biotin operon repressor|nr:helix-turn-helix domain-containing protein [Priestia megaterium]MED4836819.1 helix-turn-helix domain-containing protein [Priestia megaterium]
MEQSYFGSEVAKVIGISNSTVRKYCLTLEEQGYEFHRGINNSRVFYNKEILMLQRIKRIMNRA